MNVEDKLVKASSLKDLVEASTFVTCDYSREGSATVTPEYGFERSIRQEITLRDKNVYEIATINTRGYAESLSLSGTYANWFGINARWFWLVLNFRDNVTGNLYMPYPKNSNIKFKVYDDGSKFHVYMICGEEYPVGKMDLRLYGALAPAYTAHNLNQTSKLNETDIQGSLVWNSDDNFHELIASRDLTYATSSDIESMFGGGVKFLKKLFTLLFPRFKKGVEVWQNY